MAEKGEKNQFKAGDRVHHKDRGPCQVQLVKDDGKKLSLMTTDGRHAFDCDPGDVVAPGTTRRGRKRSSEVEEQLAQEAAQAPSERQGYVKTPPAPLNPNPLGIEAGLDADPEGPPPGTVTGAAKSPVPGGAAPAPDGGEWSEDDTVEDLRAHAHKHGVSLHGATTKGEIVKHLKKADKGKK
jgi:hypothetical protein